MAVKIGVGRHSILDPERPGVEVHVWILCLLFVFRCLLLPGDVIAQTVRISVPEIPFGRDLLNYPGPIGMVMRNAVGGELVQRQSGGLTTRFSDRFVAGGGGIRWSFRIPDGIYLHSGRELLEADVIYSLEHCKAIEESGFVDQVWKGYHSSSVRGAQRWVTVQLRDDSTASQRSMLPELVAQCTLFDRLVHPLFGGLHGVGTNFSSIGPYEVISFRPSRRISLLRRLVYRDDHRSGPTEVVLTVPRNDLEALDSLRSGSIDLFFPNNQEVIAEAQKDETLRVLQCSIYTVVFRNGLRTMCQPELEIALLGYQ